MIRRPPRSTRTDTLFPYTTLFRSGQHDVAAVFQQPRQAIKCLASHDHGRALRQRLETLQVSGQVPGHLARSEEHTSELHSLMRISYDVFCLKKKKKTNTTLYI